MVLTVHVILLQRACRRIAALAASTIPPDSAVKLIIAGSPANTAVAGQFYEFISSMRAAPAGQKLSYSIVNKPPWASFLGTLGALVGTPTSADAGTYANIVITVSDGTTELSLAPFTLMVLAAPSPAPNPTAALTKITLSWLPSLRNTDGSPLTDLQGYRFYFGTDPTVLHWVEDLPAGQTALVFRVPAGNCCFALTSFNAENIESDKSGVACATI